jgi:alkanesulfonate monooxygenase SsuD/methylene tetrahydromethanopterin reductase-like flavin-dependent oxidoreductase (luciferase family)
MTPKRIDITLGLPTFIDGDVVAARETARQNLALYTSFPFFQRLFRASGFAAEANQMERGDGASALSDRVLDAICLLGSIDDCGTRLDQFRATGVDLPILYPPIGVGRARMVIEAFQS